MAVDDLLSTLKSPHSPVPVLIVDDDMGYVGFVREAVAQAGNPPLHLLHARTLAEADRIVADQYISVVLLDVHLPDGDGIQWLRARRAQMHAAVVLVTADPEATTDPEVVSGAQDLIVKSQVEPDQLVRSIRYAADRERARQQLLRSREYFQSLIERARDLITVVDERGLILYQSPASRYLLGAPPEFFVGQSLFSLLSAEERPVAQEMLAQVISGCKEVGSREFVLTHADGTTRALDMIASAVPPIAGRRRAVLNSRDVTERRRNEEQIRKGDVQLRLAQRMEAIGRLAGGVAHDFSNVLTVITAACESLGDAARAGEPADPAKIDTILRNCARARSLTQQLLAFSRQQTLAPRPIDLGALVKGTGELLNQLIGEGIALTVDVGSDLKPIEADPVQIEQVVMNLAINARDAMPGGGALTIELRNELLDAAFAEAHAPMTPGEWVLLRVTDTGHGMDLDTRARAFEPFFTTKDPARGTGLGLSTAYGIVKQSGGYIWLESEPGSGTVFSIYLPPTTALPVEATPVGRQAEKATGRPATILLTEDEQDVRDLLSEMLAQHGYTVVEATNPAQALERSLSRRIDLLLTDVVMPGGSGSDLAREITALHPGLKVLFMSGYPEHGQVEFGRPPESNLMAGAPFLPKPFTRDLLLEQIRTLLG